jgi:hypothetical protein
MDLGITNSNTKNNKTSIKTFAINNKYPSDEPVENKLTSSEIR